MVAITTKFALLLPFAVSFARAANDWSVKCKGECSYDTNGTNGRAFATVSLSADNTNVLSDITSAASWELLDCPADWSSGAKDVRLVCVADDPAKDCNDVTSGGAVNTLVRLPENCGTGPFARISAWGESNDQTVPKGSTADSKLKLRKRDAPPAKVMKATLDWKLAEVPASRGTVKLALTASNNGATNSRIVNTRTLKRAIHNGPSPLERRFGFGDIVDGVKDAAGAVADKAKEAAGAVTDTADKAKEAADQAAKDAADAAAKAKEAADKAAADAAAKAKETADKAKDAAKDTADKAGDVAGKVGDAAKDAAGKVGDAAKDAADKAGDIAGDANKVGIDQNGALDTIKVKDNFPLFDTSLSCSLGLADFTANVDTNVDLDSQMNIGFAILMNGTVVPPAIDDFGISAVVSGYAKGTININALLSGDIDSGNIPVFKAGIPGLSLPGIFTLGPQAAINVRAGAGITLNTAVAVPITWNFPLLEFVMPPQEGAAQGDAAESNTAVDFQASFAPGDLNADAEVHVIPSLNFGIDAIGGFAKAQVFIEADADGRVDMNSTIGTDLSMDGCVKMSTGINVNAGARGTFLKFFSDATTIPIFNKRADLFTKCFGAGDGPASAVLDNGDGTFTNGAGDLVNENGELVDADGKVIPDNDAADADEEVAPIVGEDGKPIADDAVIIDNGDGTFEDGLGNPTNADGQLIDDEGNLLGSELDLAGIKDDDGADIAPDDVLVENEDGSFTANDGSQLDADGNPIDSNGLTTGAGMEQVVDENGNPIAPEDLIIDNEDGSFSDFFGNIVDQWGGAIDVNGTDIIPTTLTPQTVLEQPKQEDADPLPAADPDAPKIKTADEVKQLAADLLKKGAPAPAADKKEDAPPAPPRRRTSEKLAKRAFGCSPSFVGNTPVTKVDQLVRFF
ncbi:hypothetical protein R3P38DRAFT_3465266 [Favolaschia claudopus]|uniref:Uncharacterized protein n=1 Tax=Favolaschia claudopus TaxID=2862362 RepID=A0AAV9ZFD4_9AGAR